MSFIPVACGEEPGSNDSAALFGEYYVPIYIPVYIHQ